MTSSHLVRRYRRGKVLIQPVKCGCGFAPILACSLDPAAKVKRFWFECPNDDCPSLAPQPVQSVREAAGNWNEHVAKTVCISCGKPGRLSNADGVYCADCMKLHLLEKMFVQVTELSGPKHSIDSEAKT